MGLDADKVNCGGKLRDPCPKQRKIMERKNTDCPIQAADRIIEEDFIFPEELAYEYCKTDEGKERVYISSDKLWSYDDLFGMGSDNKCPVLINHIKEHLQRRRDEYGEEDQGTGIANQDDSLFNLKNKKLRKRRGKCSKPVCNKREERRKWMYDLKDPLGLDRNKHPLLKGLPTREQDRMFDKLFKELDDHNIRRKQYFLTNTVSGMGEARIRDTILEQLVDRGYDVDLDNLTETLIEVHGFPTDGTLSTFVVGMVLYADYGFELSPSSEHLDFNKLARATGLANPEENSKDGIVCGAGVCALGPINGEVADELRTLDMYGNGYIDSKLFNSFSINKVVTRIRSLTGDRPWELWEDIEEKYNNAFNSREVSTMTSFPTEIEIDSTGLSHNIYRIIFGDILIVGNRVEKIGFKLQVIDTKDYHNPKTIAATWAELGGTSLENTLKRLHETQFFINSWKRDIEKLIYENQI